MTRVTWQFMLVANLRKALMKTSCLAKRSFHSLSTPIMNCRLSTITCAMSWTYTAWDMACEVKDKTVQYSTLQCHDAQNMGLFVGCLTSQQHARVSQGRICNNNFTCRHTEIEVADQTFHLTQSQYTDTGSTSPSADPITRGAWQGSHWSAYF